MPTWKMKTAFCLITLLAILTTGCATGDPPRGNRTATSQPPLPDTTVAGRVVSVNPALRYVVMDFPLRSLPAIDQRLNVYRQNQRVGIVKVTGPIMGTVAAGDIVTGQATLDDEVRED